MIERPFATARRSSRRLVHSPLRPGTTWSRLAGRLTALAVAAFGAAFVAACKAPPPSDTARVSGFAEATEVRIAPEVGGRLVELAAEEGTVVAAGQIVGRLDTSATELAIARARTDREQALAQLRLVEAPPRTEDVRQAEAQVSAAAAELNAARVDESQAMSDFKRFDDLVKANAGARKVRDDAETRVQMTKERVTAAAERVNAATQALARVKAGARRQEVDVARARVAAADAQLATLDKTLRDATIVSPASGTVTQKLAEVGEIVAPRAPLLVVADLDHAWATVYVSEPLLPAIAIGRTAKVLTDGSTATLEGRVSYVSPQAEFTPRNVQTSDERAKLVYRVKIAVDNRQGVLKPGMPVEAELRLDRPNGS